MIRKPGTWRNLFGRGARRTLLAMALAVVAGIATAGAAPAGGLHRKTCVEVRNQHVICLLVTDDFQSPYPHHYKVHVGIDVYMSQHDAQNIVDDGGVIWAVAWGADPVSDDYLQGIGRTRVWSWERGLSAEFEESIYGGTLDEDFPDADEVYALVNLYLGESGRTRTFRSDTVEASFNG
jgi:hypothetical protein